MVLWCACGMGACGFDAWRLVQQLWGTALPSWQGSSRRTEVLPNTCLPPAIPAAGKEGPFVHGGGIVGGGIGGMGSQSITQVGGRACGWVGRWTGVNSWGVGIMGSQSITQVCGCGRCVAVLAGWICRQGCWWIGLNSLRPHASCLRSGWGGGAV